MWPLMQQLKKDNFGWSDEVEAAFESVKKAMVLALVLALLNFSNLFVIKPMDSTMVWGWFWCNIKDPSPILVKLFHLESVVSPFMK